MKAARKHGVKRVVMASSAAIYGNDPALPKEETMRPQPESPYAIAKSRANTTCASSARSTACRLFSLRYFNVFAPPGSEVLLLRRHLEIHGRYQGRPDTHDLRDGLQTRDFVFVKDVVQANLLAMRSGKAGHGEALTWARARA